MEGARLTALFGPSRYAARLPIGAPELLQSFPAERLRDFYRDHDRADCMALIVVGNIVDSAVDALVRELFLDLRQSTMTRAAAAIPAHADTRFAALSIPEAPATSVSVVHKRRAEPAAAVADFRAMLERTVVVRMMNTRLAEIVRCPDSLFVGAAVADQVLAGGVATITVGAVAAGAPDRALRARRRNRPRAPAWVQSGGARSRAARNPDRIRTGQDRPAGIVRNARSPRVS